MGRKIYANLKKAIKYIIAIHVPILAVVLLPLAFGWPYLELFTPIHVIFLELVMGPTCSIVFENEPMEPELMLRRPRKFSVAFFTIRELLISILQGLVVSAALMVLIYRSMKNGVGQEVVRAEAFTALIIANILLTLTGRSRERSVLTTIRYPNRLVPVMLSLTLLVLLACLFWPPASGLFGFGAIDMVTFLEITALAAVSVGWIEFTKHR